jgi:hypothetical protein
MKVDVGCLFLQGEQKGDSKAKIDANSNNPQELEQ